MLLVSISFVAIAILSPISKALEVDPQRNFQLRECRQRSWRGDIGSLPSSVPLSPAHPKDVKVHSRQRRFIGWPSGSSLSFYPGLSVPLETFNNGFNSLKLYVGFPFTLELPDAPVVMKGMNQAPSTYGDFTGYGEGGYTYNRQDLPSDYFYNYYNHASDSLENYPNGYSSYSSFDPYGPYSKRSIDVQRQSGFNVLQNGLENLGLPGKACVMRAVCEVADEPISDLGLIGDFLNLFLAAGYGEGSDQMSDFVAAEDIGHREGDCESHFSDCPLPLAGILQGGLSYLHAGFADAGTQATSFL